MRILQGGDRETPSRDAAAADAAPLAACRDVGVSYGHGEARVDALSAVDFEVQEHESVALWGRSGSGKTTLLHVLGGLVVPTAGAVEWRGGPLASLDTVARGGSDRARVAYVFQGANLLPYFTAYENVAFAARSAGGDSHPELAAPALLELVGLDAKLDSLPAELSGGEAQRVAIARALAQDPELLLCDEPTGHLDSDTAERVLDLVDALQREFGFALVVATHDADVAARLSRLVELRRREDRSRRGAVSSAAGRLALLGIVRAPGRSLVRVLVLAAAVGLLGAMVLFIGSSLRTMTASATRSVPLDWQGPVASQQQATRIASAVGRQPASSRRRRSRRRRLRAPLIRRPWAASGRGRARCSQCPPAT